jgi:5,10-methylene-tetrahydrofolate dehydrogenase/methenyl tetrahydrofolate cyclohydrolase
LRTHPHLPLSSRHPHTRTQGCIELLDRSGVPIAGAHAVVLGRSNIVGLPAALLLQARDATVTVVHSGTRDVASYVRRADILIAAAGKAGMVKAEWLKPGAVVIDVGTNSVADATKKTGYRLVGDVDFEGALRVASKVTPVPGGVGPMTIAMLLQNCLIAAQRTVEPQQEGEGEAAKAT